eukprot:CAMPEP_0181412570 /NCGR_PEP_ID=MMETSP1110-20121109/8492_1 /TAXON_ID=174948 /ORGANISM="Symbiodinium sp., Strain CCMP421" /LENGTH=309 /DNA_ID=CAMNT_0023535291 /DNA_START=66 /DNA_END=995 /DNA_ORIENTATION=+
MKLRAETNFLLKKQLKQALGPLEIIGAAGISTAAFALTYWCTSSEIRESSSTVAMLIPAILAVIALLSNYIGLARYRSKRTSRAWLVMALCLWAGIATGLVLGNDYWWLGLAKSKEYRQMASYVNINPSADKGGSFMDAGAVYFKDGSRVERSKAIAFRNGLTYCVAPISLDPLEAIGNTSAKKTSTGFLIPASGSLDFWAVGTDCCGTTGTPFDCYDAANPFARAALRVLDNTHTEMYQMAVKEWVATTGIPANHPIFFNWVIDPLALEAQFKSLSNSNLFKFVFVYALASLFLSYALHMFLRYFKVL